MGIGLRFTSTICIVNILLTFVTTLNAAVLGTINDAANVRKDIENLFDSVARNNLHRGETFRDLLKQDVEKEQEAFDTAKGGMWITQNRNADKKKNEGENVALVKRDEHYDPRINGEMTNDHQENGAPNAGSNAAEARRLSEFRTAPLDSSPYANWDSTVKGTYYPQRPQYDPRGTQRTYRRQYHGQRPDYSRNFARNGTQTEHQSYRQRSHSRRDNRPPHYRNEFEANAPSRQYDRHYDAFNGNYTTTYYNNYNSFVPPDQQSYYGSPYDSQNYASLYGQPRYDYTPGQYYHSQPAYNPNYPEQYNDPRYGQQQNYPQQQYHYQYPQHQGDRDFRQTPGNSDQLQFTVRTHSSIPDVPISAQQNNAYFHEKKSGSMNAKIVTATEETTTRITMIERMPSASSVRNVSSYVPRRGQQRQQQKQEEHQLEERQGHAQTRERRRQRVNKVRSTTPKPQEEEKQGRFSRLCKYVKGIFRKITFCKDEDEDEDEKTEPKHPERDNTPQSYDRIDQRTSSYRPRRINPNRSYNPDQNYRSYQKGPSRHQQRNPDTNYFRPLSSTGHYRRDFGANNEQGSSGDQKNTNKPFNYKPFHYNYNHPDVREAFDDPDSNNPGYRDNHGSDTNSANSDNPNSRASPSYFWRYSTSTP